MTSGAPQIEHVMAGRAILWPDASEPGTVPAHIVPIENQTVDVEAAGASRITGQANLITIEPFQNANVVVVGAGYVVYVGLLTTESIFARVSPPFLILPHHTSTQSGAGSILPAAATGAPLPSKSALATCRDLLNSRRDSCNRSSLQLCCVK